MSANKLVLSSPATGGRVDVLLARFATGEGGWQSFTGSWCEWADRIIGPESAYAQVNIPHQGTNEAANSVALNPDGPIKNIKIGTRAMIERVRTVGGVPIWKSLWYVGKVIAPGHVRGKGKDGLSVLLTDFKHDLKSVRVTGREIWVPDGSGSGTSHYQQGWPAIFNQGGRPDRMVSDTGYSMFAPYPDYGLVDGEEPPGPDTKDPGVFKKKASYWLLSHILEYLRRTTGPEASEQTNWPWLPKCPDWVDWPESFGSEVDRVAVANFNIGAGQTNFSRGGARKGRMMNLEGWSVLDAIAECLNMAGGWTLNVSPLSSKGSDGGETFKALMSCVPSRYSAESAGITIPFAAGDDADPTLKGAVITGCDFHEDGENLATMFGGSGDLVFVETRLSTKASDGPTMEWAHSSERFEAWKLEAGNGGAPTLESVKRANRLFPEVASMLRIKRSYNFMADTAFSAYPRAPINRPIWPTLLSLMTDVAETDEGDTQLVARAQDFAGLRWPIRFEIYNEESTAWEPESTVFDGLTTYDNGNIEVPLLREPHLNSSGLPVGDVWDYNDPENPTDGDQKLDIFLRDVRATLAIPCDHRVTYATRLSCDKSTQATDLLDIDRENADLDRIEPGYSRRHYVDLQDLYKLYLRSTTSYPRPESDGGSAATARPNQFNAIRSDHAMLEAHIKKDALELGRLPKRGSLDITGWLETYEPGIAIKELKPKGKSGQPPYPIRSILRGVRLSSKRDETVTKLMVQ